MPDIWFDMDGTIADLYGVENWLPMLRAEDPAPYAAAAPLLKMQPLARKLNQLISRGYTVNIISWTARGGSENYNNEVREAKLKWLKIHLSSVQFSEIHIVPYGTPKENFGTGILFDDEQKNRESWNGIAFDEKNIMEKLREL